MSSVWLAGLSLMAIVVVTAVVTRLLAALGTRTAEGTAERIPGPVQNISLALVVGAVYLAVFRYDPGSVGARVTSTRATGVVVNAAAIAVTTTVAFLVSRRLLRPVTERLRPGELSVPKRFTRLQLAGLAALQFALAVVFTAPLYGLISYHILFAVPIILVAVVLNGALERPLTVPPIGLLRARNPTEDERRRIEDCYDRFGREPGRIVVSARENDIGVTAVGSGSFRTVALTEPFLQRVDDDELAVALAQADERARRYQDFSPALGTIFLISSLCFLVVLVASFLLGTPIIVGRFFGLLVLGTVESGVGMTLCILGLVAVASVARNTAYRADDFAVSQFGEETVGDVYRELGDLLWNHEPDEDKKQLLSTEPKRSVRLARIGVESDDSGVVAAPDE